MPPRTRRRGEKKQAAPVGDGTAIVIFGASGDLAGRKVVPALYSLRNSGHLSKSFRIIGVARSPFTDISLGDRLRERMSEYSKQKPKAREWDAFARQISYIRGDYDDPRTYGRLSEELMGTSGSGQTTNCLFYLATPPTLFPSIARLLGKAGLSDQSSGRGWRRLVVEKPFGTDLHSARMLNSQIHESFKEKQVYRIDHYLGKETVQNILSLRFANTIFEPIWNRNYIDHVQITIAESVGVEQRAGYYDDAGVVRDMVQNHVLQLVSLTAMEPPVDFNERELRDEKVKILQAISPLDTDATVFGQYEGYRKEEGVARNSKTPTYVAQRLFVDNWRWQGVPFYVRTGKRLFRKATEISLKFKRVPHILFRKDRDLSPNRISLCIQPDEGIHLQFEVQAPGMEMKTTRASLLFHYSGFRGSPLPEAYERLVLDAISGDQVLFAREDEVELAWKVVEPLLHVPGRNSVHTYAPGSWGPPQADQLIGGDGRSWELACLEKQP
jgi:glucose-6-phosphate 1-dehydrogenase